MKSIAFTLTVKKLPFREISILSSSLTPLTLSLTKARQLPSYMIVISTNVLWSPPLIERVRNWLHIESCQIKSFSITHFPITEWYNVSFFFFFLLSFEDNHGDIRELFAQQIIQEADCATERSFLLHSIFDDTETYIFVHHIFLIIYSWVMYECFFIIVDWQTIIYLL